MIDESIKVIVQEKRLSDYVRVVNFIEINKSYDLVNRPEFVDYLIAVYEKYCDHSVLNLLLKANIDLSNVKNQRSVIVLSPNLYSKYTLSVVEKLVVMGITVEAIVCRRFSLKRLIKELKSSLGGFLQKVLNKLIFRKSYYSDSLPTKYSDSFRKRCKSMASDLIVFTGGGIISSKTFKSLPGKDFINCHSGFLPQYRGVDCIYWAIYNEDRDKVGVSCHFMTPLIDRGDIISTEKVLITPQVKTIKQLDLIVESKVYTICNSVNLYFSGLIAPKTQTFENGGKYFKMDKKLMRKVQLRLFHEG
jgi:folate-dependent phosphoribosylglycinamide formyltransferase PurN